MAGVVGFNCIDQTNEIGHLGYWLGKEYTGKGIMSLVTADLINIGFNEFPIQKIEIRCATTNFKSRAIPERLGFKNEGTLRKAEKVYDKYFDMVVYGLLKNEKLC
jgi:ribosomal-protein-serine acetyltransferase